MRSRASRNTLTHQATSHLKTQIVSLLTSQAASRQMRSQAPGNTFAPHATSQLETQIYPASHLKPPNDKAASRQMWSRASGNTFTHQATSHLKVQIESALHLKRIDASSGFTPQKTFTHQRNPIRIESQNGKASVTSRTPIIRPKGKNPIAIHLKNVPRQPLETLTRLTSTTVEVLPRKFGGVSPIIDDTPPTYEIQRPSKYFEVVLRKYKTLLRRAHTGVECRYGRPHLLDGTDHIDNKIARTPSISSRLWRGKWTCAHRAVELQAMSLDCFGAFRNKLHRSKSTLSYPLCFPGISFSLGKLFTLMFSLIIEATHPLIFYTNVFKVVVIKCLVFKRFTIRYKRKYD